MTTEVPVVANFATTEPAPHWPNPDEFSNLYEVTKQYGHTFSTILYALQAKSNVHYLHLAFSDLKAMLSVINRQGILDSSI